MDTIKLVNLLNIYTNQIRKTMNDIIEEIDGDFTGWCDGASILMYRLLKERLKLDNKNNYIVKGTFKGKGHFWNIVNGMIVDLTIDQFGKYKVGVVNQKFIKNYSQEKIMSYSKDDLMCLSDVYEFIGWLPSIE